MKITFIILALIFTTVDSPISFLDLIFAYENDLDAVTDKFNSLGFEFETTDSNDIGGDAVVWRYTSVNKDVGLNLFVAKYCFKSNCGGVQVQTNSESLHSKLKKEAVALGFIYKDSEIGKYGSTDEVSSYYYKDNLMLIMSVIKYKSGKDNLYSALLSTSE